jgi:NADH-quinone oxidoreductase subunit J
MQIELALFYALGTLAVLAALAVLGSVRNTFAAALALLVAMVSIAGVLVLLDAHFLAAVRVMVAVSFCAALLVVVSMLFDFPQTAFAPLSVGRVAVKAVAVAAALWLVQLWVRELPRWVPAEAELPAGFGGTREVGRVLYTEFVVPLELAGALLLAALVASLVLALRESD